MFLAGHTLDNIAAMRGITVTTVFSHLIPHLATGEIELVSLVDVQKADRIREIVAQIAEPRLRLIKDVLGDDYSYDEIRAVLSVSGSNRTPKAD